MSELSIKVFEIDLLGERHFVELRFNVTVLNSA